jgi:uncharacterized protein
MKHANFNLELKQLDTEGSFEGLLSTYGNVDQAGDVVVAGAFEKTIKEKGRTRPLLYQHRPDVPIGMLTLYDTPTALAVKGQLLMELDDAQKAYALIRAKIVTGLSIGFESVKDTIQNGVRYIKEINLFEGSVVTFACNEEALITAVKALETQQQYSESKLSRCAALIDESIRIVREGNRRLGAR